MSAFIGLRSTIEHDIELYTAVRNHVGGIDLASLKRDEETSRLLAMI